MEFGIAMPARVDAWPLVRRGEELGFTHAFLSDSQMLYAETFACLALCAEHTTRIMLGPGVTNPSTRIAPLMASALGTINQMAPGRAFFGIGSGNTTRRAMGMPPDTMDHFAEYVRVVRSLTRGELVEYTEGDRTRLIQMIHREGSIDPTFMNFHDPIPVYIAASGAKARAIAGELSDRVIIGGMPSPELIARVRAEMQPGADRVGRRAEDIPIHLNTMIYVRDPDEPIGSPRMKASVARNQSSIGCYAAGRRGELPGGMATAQMVGRRIADADIPAAYRPLAEAYRRLKADVTGPAALDGAAWYVTAYDGHGWRVHPELLPIVTDDMLRSQAIIGTADEVLDLIKQWDSFGISSISTMVGHSIANSREMIERFARGVIQRY